LTIYADHFDEEFLLCLLKLLFQSVFLPLGVGINLLTFDYYDVSFDRSSSSLISFCLLEEELNSPTIIGINEDFL